MRKTTRLYAAYGSNLNLKQMGKRCPTAKVIGTTVLKGYKLLFRGVDGSSVATVERSVGDSVPVLIWEFQPKDEEALDVYEGYPRLYRKEMLKVRLGGKTVSVMVYIMNGGYPLGLPGTYYFNIIREGYKSAGFDVDILHEAAKKSSKKGESYMDSVIKEQILAVRDTGETNMFDVNAVMRIAMREGFYELVVYLQEHKSEYARFILTGKATDKDDK